MTYIGNNMLAGVLMADFQWVIQIEHDRPAFHRVPSPGQQATDLMIMSTVVMLTLAYATIQTMSNVIDM